MQIEISRCVACVHINNQNSKTLPLMCPIALESGIPFPCFATNSNLFGNLNEINKFSDYLLKRYKHLEGKVPLVEMVFRSRWEMDTVWADKDYIAEMEIRWDELYSNNEIRPYLLIMEAY